MRADASLMATLVVAASVLGASREATAQGRPGDSYALRRLLGNDSYIWESYAHAEPGPRRAPPTTNPAALAAQPRMPGMAPQLSAGMSMTAPPLTTQANNSLNFYGGQEARATLAQMPRRSAFVPQSQAGPRIGSKPFTGAQSDPTVSPYTNLFRDEDIDSAPNYYAFVRPQLQQQERNQQQQRQIQSLQRQVVRAAYSAPAAAPTTGGMPGTGHGSRYGDTGQFYGSWRR